MTTAALQSPWAEKPGQRLGARLFRKQILPIGEISYEGRTLAFTREKLAELAANFRAGVMDLVPFVLATDRNEHTSDPERVRGEVKGVELTDQGLDAVLELSEKGAELVGDTPKLPVSARIAPDPEKGWVLEHICGTVNPRVTGMRPWEALNLSKPGQALLDLSAAGPVSYKEEDGQGQAFRTGDMDDTTLTTDELTAIRGLLAKADKPAEGDKPPATEVKADPDKPGSDGKAPEAKAADAELSDSDLDRVIEKLLADDGDTAPEEKRELVAQLTASDRQTIDLAKRDADDAKRQAADATRRLREAEWREESRRYAEAGVPRAMLDLAQPILADPQVKPIDLSNGQTADPQDVVRKILDEAKGTIDLTGPIGSGSSNGDDAEEAARKNALAQWEKEAGS